jgi:hypothetical protein
MELNNLPSTATVEIKVSKNKTIIELDFGVHPKDVDYLHHKIEMLLLDLTITEEFNKKLNKELLEIQQRKEAHKTAVL